MILTKIREVPFDKYYFEAIEAVFEIKNKTDENIVMQVDTLSVDGKMVDSSNISFSPEIQPHKIADSDLTISNEHDNKLPKMEDHMEIEFRMFNWDNDDFREHFIVNVDL